MPGWYDAHVPALGLTTHGEGVDGARAAIVDLQEVWLSARREAGEAIPAPTECLFSTVEIDDRALETA